MAGSKTAYVRQVKRCAVCKIDLKGRFVYVDDATEQLTGYTKEELFGKSFLDLVSETGKPLVSHVLYHRNHYETSFDSVRLEILDRNKKTTPATVIFSLNFIAGNPVNLQVIIDVDTNDECESVVDDVDSSLRDFIHELLVLPPERFAAEAPAILADYFCKDRASIYRWHQGELQLLSAATSDHAAGLLGTGDVEPLALLSWVAQSREEYCCDDAACVQKAIERSGSAPHEFILPIQLAADHLYVVRLQFSDKADSCDLQQRISDARQAITLLQRLGAVGLENCTDQDQQKPRRETDRKTQGRGMLQEAQLAITSAMQVLNRLDKSLRD